VEFVKESLGVPAVIFSETRDTKSLQQVQVSKAKYKVLGIISGPILQRRIISIMKKKFAMLGGPNIIHRTGAGDQRDSEQNIIIQRAADSKQSGETQVFKRESSENDFELSVSQSAKDYEARTEGPPQGKDHVIGGTGDIAPASLIFENRKKVSESKKQSRLEKLIISSVNAMKKEEVENSPSLRIVREFAAMPVALGNQKGCLLVATSNFAESVQETCHSLKAELEKQMQKQGQHIEIGSSIIIRSGDYDFFQNTEPGLEFNFLSSYGVGEVAIKFIEAADVWPSIDFSGATDMAKVELKEIIPNESMTLDLYVYMKVSDRYFKVVKKGAKLESDRKDRMVEQGTDVFIKKEEVNSYRTFQAKHIIGAIVNSMSNTKNKKAG
jgi:hypothetical protein